MNTGRGPRTPDGTASALLLAMMMTGIALAILAGAMTWSANSTRLTHGTIQYTTSLAAAEAATEKVLSQVTRDFLLGGERTVADNMASYRLAVPTTADSLFWSQWEFNNAQGQTARTYVQGLNTTNYVVLNSTYAGLRGFVSTVTIVAHARQASSSQNVIRGVFQEVQLARIPVFQFAMYGSSDMEIACGQPFNITGRVHANGTLYCIERNIYIVTHAIYIDHYLCCGYFCKLAIEVFVHVNLKLF